MKRTNVQFPETQPQQRNQINSPEYNPGAPDLQHAQTCEAGEPAAASLQAEEIERPSTFQLAHLAAILATRPDSVNIPPGEVVLEALQLWDAAFKVNLIEQQERDIWKALYHDQRPEWERRLKSYVGDKFGLYELLSQPRFQVETEVLPNIFPGETETATSRREKFSDLIRYAQQHQFFTPAEAALHPEFKPEEQDQAARQLQLTPDGEDLLPGKLNALAVRMLVEAQQAKSRNP